MAKPGGTQVSRRHAALGRDLDLIVTLDEATGEIYSAFLNEQARGRACSAWPRRLGARRPRWLPAECRIVPASAVYGRQDYQV
jgi:hypothetical protein